jgi:hypothetical protein
MAEPEDHLWSAGLGSYQNLGLRSLLILHIHIPSTSLGQCNRASQASQPQKSVLLQPQPGGVPRSPWPTCGGIGLKKKNTQGLVATRWPPVVHPRQMTLCRYSCAFLCSHTIGNTEFINSGGFCVLSMRRQRQEGGVQYCSRFSITMLAASRDGGGVVILTLARPSTSQQRRAFYKLTALLHLSPQPDYCSYYINVIHTAVLLQNFY